MRMTSWYETPEKKHFTDEEVAHAKLLGNVKNIGVTNIGKFWQNINEGPKRTKHAMKNGCYLEVISLRLQHIEFWLRMYLAARTRKKFDPKKSYLFGKLIQECKDNGFRKDLAKRLSGFNCGRRKAIHRYLMGETDYDQLQKVCIESEGLDGDVFQYVVKEIP